MSVQDIGIENLPNIYVHKIVMSGTLITVTCLMKDSIGQQSWYNREQLSSLRVKLGLMYSGEKFTAAKDGLNNGLDSLYNYEYNEPGILIQTRKANVFSLGEEFNEQNIGFYYSDFTFQALDLPAAEDIILYVACYVADLGFGNALYDKYYGPMSSEIIKANGQINTESGYFYFPEDVNDSTIANTEYGGPVHVHEGNYMQGSEHVETAHYSLRYVREKNTKIISEDGLFIDPTQPTDSGSPES